MSKSILDERPVRRTVKLDQQETETPVVVWDPVLIVTSPGFFLQRDKHNKPIMKFSDVTLSAVLAKFKNVVVFVAPFENHREVLAPLYTDSPVRVCEMDKNDVKESFRRIDATMKKFGVQLVLPTAHRTASWLRLREYIKSAHATVVNEGDHAEIGIEAEREYTFQEMVSRRRKDAW